MEKSKTFDPTIASHYKLLKLSSPSFRENGMIPSEFTCEGRNVNPELNISDIPKDAKSLAIIVDDPDAPSGSFCHWVVWNIPVTHCIHKQENHGATGMNDYGHHKYDGPCPPSGIHRYYFKIYALDCTLDIPVSSGKIQLESAMSDHILAFGCLTGRYNKIKIAPEEVL